MTYEHPLWPLALKNPTAVPLAQAGGVSPVHCLLQILQSIELCQPASSDTVLQVQMSQQKLAALQGER